MTTTPATVRVAGIITDFAIKTSSPSDANPEGMEYIEVKVLPAGKEYAVTVRDFNGVLKGVRKGQEVAIDVTERKGTAQPGRSAPIFRNAVKLVGAAEAPDRVAPTPAPASKSDAEKAWAQPVDQTRASIEAQVCLKEAWETVRDLIRSDKLDPRDEVATYKALATYMGMGMRAMREAKGD